MTATLLLRLAGPLQAWGGASRFTRRETRREPTKSGVLGLLAAAQGRRRIDPVEDLVGLRFGVRVDQPGQLVRDFQTAIRWRDGSSMPLSYRYYVADAVFLAGVEGDEGLLGALDEAVRRPAFPLYLGRRSCPVEGRVSLGVVCADLESALRQTDWLASPRHRRRQGNEVHLPLVLDAGAGQEVAETLRDVPLSFSPERRDYGWRDVHYAAPVVKHNAEGRDELDFLAAIGGG